MNIRILGSGTCQLQSCRMASSVLVEFQDFKIVYDFGRGVTLRLIDINIKQDDIEHIVLSHLHPDHVSDIVPFLQAARWSKVDPRFKDLNIYAPVWIQFALDDIFKAYKMEKLLKNENYQVNFHPVSNSFEIKGNIFDFIPLKHEDFYGRSHGLRFNLNGIKYALTGDTSMDLIVVEFISGADIAVIDAGHMTKEEIADLAAASRTKKIICSHLYDELDEDELISMASLKGFKGELLIAKDLMQI